MFRRFTGLASALLAAIGLSGATDTPKPTVGETAKAKKALQEVQDFMGIWNVEGIQKVGVKTEAWKEKIDWSWKFKADQPPSRWRSPKARGSITRRVN